MTREELLYTLARLPAKIATAEEHLLLLEIGLTAARATLIQGEDALLLLGPNGPIDGKNEAMRAAQVRDATEASRSQVAELEESVARARMQLRVLGVEFSAAKAMARLLAGGEG